MSNSQYKLAKAAIKFSAENSNSCDGHMWSAPGIVYLGVAKQNGNFSQVEIISGESPYVFEIDSLVNSWSTLDHTLKVMANYLYSSFSESKTLTRAGVYENQTGQTFMRAIEQVEDKILHVFSSNKWHRKFKVCLENTQNFASEELTSKTEELLAGLEIDNVDSVLVPMLSDRAIERELTVYLLCKA